MDRKNFVKIDVIWRWCAVCMSNQYHEMEDNELVCTNPLHKYYLHRRSDSWIKKLPEWKELRQGLQ